LSWAGNPERKGNLNEQTIQDRPLAVAMVEGTPAGTIVLAASEIGLAFVSFQGLQDFKALVLDKANATSSSALEIVQAAGCQVQEYFDHKRKKFDLPLDMEGQPEFRQAVLRETQRIPYGTTLTYGEVAARIHKPGAARAVGGALAHNPLSLVIPCHRVVAGDGSMHGFSAPGGIATKIMLLKLEGLSIRYDRLVR
jgi:methylated-DNA-[protein]-cysteine S-methyltransferase